MAIFIITGGAADKIKAAHCCYGPKLRHKMLKMSAENRIARAPIWSVYLHFEASSRESQYEERKQTQSRWRTRDTATSIYYFCHCLCTAQLAPAIILARVCSVDSVNLLEDLKIILQSCCGLNSWEPVNETPDQWPVELRAVNKASRNFHCPGNPPYWGHLRTLWNLREGMLAALVTAY